MKSRNLNNIDIQVIDEFGRFVEFNNIDWNITLQIIIFRTHEISFKELNLPTTNLKLPKEPKEKEPKDKEPKEKNKDLEELKLLSRK